MKDIKKGYLYLLMVVGFILSAQLLNAQDTIILKNNEEVSAKVLVVGISNITYKKFENLNGPSYEITKDDVLKITYENGRDEFFLQDSNTPNNTSKNTVDPSINLIYKGTADADHFYNKKWPLWITFGGTVVFLPVGLAAGLISGIVTPKIEVLIPNQQLLNSPAYYDAFMKRSKQRKWGKVGKGLVLGIGVNVLAFIVLSN